MTGAGFPHSDIHGSKLGRQLPVASRSHPRPSSASGAKASTVGSCSLELLLDARARYGILKGSHGEGAIAGRASSRRGLCPRTTEQRSVRPSLAVTERPEPAIGGVREGLRRVIDSDVPPDHHPVWVAGRWHS